MDGALGILPPSHLSTCYCLTPILCQLHLTSHCARPLCTLPILTRLQLFLLFVCVRTPTLPGLYWLAFIGHIYWWTCSIVPRLSFAKESRRRLLATSRQFCFFRMFLDHSSRLNACRHCRAQQLIHSCSRWRQPLLPRGRESPGVEHAAGQLVTEQVRAWHPRGHGPCPAAGAKSAPAVEHEVSHQMLSVESRS